MPAADRHEQLLDLAEALFVRQGYAATTMEDLARAAGVTRPVVYNHLRSREAAYLACVERARTSYEGRMLATVDPDASPIEQLRAGADAFFMMLEEDPGRWQLLFGGNAVLPGDATQALAALRFATIEQIRVLLTLASPGASPQRLEACAHVVSGAGERLGHWWLTRPDLDRQVLVDQFVDILWDGLRRNVEH
jgi:AcrR family transcriptional regulator